jgi:hypothetical protein
MMCLAHSLNLDVEVLPLAIGKSCTPERWLQAQVAMKSVAAYPKWPFLRAASPARLPSALAQCSHWLRSLGHNSTIVVQTDEVLGEGFLERLGAVPVSQMRVAFGGATTPAAVIIQAHLPPRSVSVNGAYFQARLDDALVDPIGTLKTLLGPQWQTFMVDDDNDDAVASAGDQAGSNSPRRQATQALLRRSMRGQQALLDCLVGKLSLARVRAVVHRTETQRAFDLVNKFLCALTSAKLPLGWLSGVAEGGEGRLSNLSFSFNSYLHEKRLKMIRLIGG